MTMPTLLFSAALLAMLCCHTGYGASLPGRASDSNHLKVGMPLPERVSGVDDQDDETDKSGHKLSSNGLVQECLRQKGTKRMLQELTSISNNIKASLPKDNIKHVKLVPRLEKSAMGIAMMREILEFYKKDVFSKVSPRVEKREDMLNALSRMVKDIHHCLHTYSVVLSPEQSPIGTMKQTSAKLKDTAVPKAVGEFNSLMGWLDTYIPERSTSLKKHLQNEGKGGALL